MQVVFRFDRLKKARLKKKMTQEVLAEQCNTSDRYIRDLEKGRKMHPSAAVVCQIASVLEIPMETLHDPRQEDEP